jgi:tryptophan synthase alpha chain
VSTRAPVSGVLADHLRQRRDEGAKLLIPYVTAGMQDNWLIVAEAVAASGADALEVGLPFSDPMIDGPVIQASSLRALQRGTTPRGVLADLALLDLGVPVVVMTYYNLIVRMGHRRMASLLAESGVAGVIVPDLPLEEVGPWAAAADGAGVATVMLVAPSTGTERMGRITERSRGFVYGIGRMGVTGEQATVASSAALVAGAAKACTELPVCVGIGVSTPEQAAEVCGVADGVIVGSALVRRLLDGVGPDGAAAFTALLRRGIDGY